MKMEHTKQARLLTDIILQSFKLNGLLISAGDELTQAYGLSSARWKVLGAIILAQMPLTVSQIARAMGQTRQAVQRLVNIMLEDGILETRDNPQHKRAKLFALTLKGREVYAQIDAKQIIWSNDLANGLRVDGLSATLAMLEKISEKLA